VEVNNSIFLQAAGVELMSGRGHHTCSSWLPGQCSST